MTINITNQKPTTPTPLNPALTLLKKLRNQYVLGISDLVEQMQRHHSDTKGTLASIHSPRVRSSAGIGSFSVLYSLGSMMSVTSHSHKIASYRVVCYREIIKHATLCNAALNLTQEGTSAQRGVSREIKTAIDNLKILRAEAHSALMSVLDRLGGGKRMRGYAP